jgi:hypothetical protein
VAVAENAFLMHCLCVVCRTALQQVRKGALYVVQQGSELMAGTLDDLLLPCYALSLRSFALRRTLAAVDVHHMLAGTVVGIKRGV